MTNLLPTNKRICAIVSRHEVETSNLNSVMRLLGSLKILNPTDADPDSLRLLRSKVSIIIDGYNEDNRELYEIPEIRRFFQALHASWPYGPYFFDQTVQTTQLLVLCHTQITMQPSSNPDIRTLGIDSESMAAFLHSSLDPMREITKRIGWTILGTIQAVKDIAISMGLELDILGNPPPDKRHRHMAYLDSEFRALAAFAWDGYMEGGPGFIMVTPGGIDNPTGSKAGYVSAGKLTSSQWSVFDPDLQRMVSEYNPRKEIVVAIEEPEGFSSYRFGKRSLYPPDARGSSQNNSPRESGEFASNQHS